MKRKEIVYYSIVLLSFVFMIIWAIHIINNPLYKRFENNMKHTKNVSETKVTFNIFVEPVINSDDFYKLPYYKKVGTYTYCFDSVEITQEQYEQRYKSDKKIIGTFTQHTYSAALYKNRYSYTCAELELNGKKYYTYNYKSKKDVINYWRHIGKYNKKAQRIYIDNLLTAIIIYIVYFIFLAYNCLKFIKNIYYCKRNKNGNQFTISIKDNDLSQSN